MACLPVFVQGPLSFTAGDGFEVVHNASSEIIGRNCQDSPPVLNEDTLMVGLPGGVGVISLKALREKIIGGP